MKGGNTKKTERADVAQAGKTQRKTRAMRRRFRYIGRFTFLRTFGVEVEKTMENHLVDPTEKAENAESSENVTDKRNQKYITPNNRLTIIVQQCAANTRLDERLRLVQRRQSEQHKFANFNVGANCGGK